MAEQFADKAEQEFRDNTQSRSFAAKVWGGLAGASFFGALMALSQALMAAAAKVGAPGNEMLSASASMLNPLPLAVIGGLAAFGIVATYMAQREETELTILRDNHQMEQQAKCMSQAVGRGPAVQQVYEQNCRSDNKTWAQTVEANKIPGQSQAIH